jgi:folate-binding protein YgfZ
MSLPTALVELSHAHGAKFVEAAGYRMPQVYTSPLEEYQQTLQGASLFDRCFRGKIELQGPEAPSFLHNLSTNDIDNLPLGGGCLTYFCTPTAKVLFEAIVYHILTESREHALWLDTTPGFQEGLVKHLDKHLISEQVEIIDRTGYFAQLHLAGPKAKAILESALGSALPELGEFMHMERTFGRSEVCHLRRHDALGVPGYDLVCHNTRAEGIARMLLAAGAKLAGLDAHELLRVEAGTPVYGIDIDENRFVMEVKNPLRAVSYAKGCYLGQEPIIMARDRAGFVNRTFKSIKVLSDTVLPAGTKLFNGSTEVGVVTSSILSPKLQAPLSLCYLRRGHQDAGLKLEAEVNGGRVGVEVI